VHNSTTVKGAAAVPLKGLSLWESCKPSRNQEGRRERSERALGRGRGVWRGNDGLLFLVLAAQGGATSLRWNRSLATLIFAAALLTRLVASTLLYRLQMDPQRDYWDFGWETGRIAHSISVGKGFSAPVYGYEGPTAWMAPVYPYPLAGVFRVFGDFSRWSALAILGLNSVFSAFTCFPVFHIARRVLGPRTAMWAGWGWARVSLCHLFFIFLSVRVWETSLTTLLLSLALWFTLVLADGSRPIPRHSFFVKLSPAVQLTAPPSVPQSPPKIQSVVSPRLTQFEKSRRDALHAIFGPAIPGVLEKPQVGPH
jgi:hypothetical protein